MFHVEHSWNIVARSGFAGAPYHAQHQDSDAADDEGGADDELRRLEQQGEHARQRYDGECRGGEEFIIDEQSEQLPQDGGEDGHGRAALARFRAHFTIDRPTARKMAANARIARSWPGQLTPRPSPTQ